jgi:hypothetical protein
MTGLFGVIILLLDIFASYNVLTAKIDTPKKIGWLLIIWIAQVLGFILWALLGPRGKKLF